MSEKRKQNKSEIDGKNEESVENGSLDLSLGRTISNVISTSTKKASAIFRKPSHYDKKIRDKYYDDSSAKERFKDKTFQGNNKVYDPYTGEELTRTQADAIAQFGNEWAKHSTETDHILSIAEAQKKYGNAPFLKTDDFKEILNSDDNYQVLSKSINVAKKDRNSKDLAKNPTFLEKHNISRKKLKKVTRTSKKAERIIHKKFRNRSAKNAINLAQQAGKNAMIEGTRTAVLMSSVNNIVAVIKCEKKPEEAICDTITDTVKGAGTAFVTGATLTPLYHVLSSSSSKFLQDIAKKNVPGKVVTAVMITGDTVIRYGKGDITTKECLRELSEKGICAAGSAAGSTIGQVIIPIPGVGSAVGCVVGGTLASTAYNTVLLQWQILSEEQRRKQQEAFEAMMRYYAEEKRREEVKQMIHANTIHAVQNSIHSIFCSGELQRFVNAAESYFENREEVEMMIAERVYVALCLKEYREQLQKTVDTYFAECKECFDIAFDTLNASLESKDYDEAIHACNMIAERFSSTTGIKDTEDFVNKFFGNEKIVF